MSAKNYAMFLGKGGGVLKDHIGSKIEGREEDQVEFRYSLCHRARNNTLSENILNEKGRMTHQIVGMCFCL